MNVYVYPDQQSAQDACNEIWLNMQAAGVQDVDVNGVPVDPQITDRWDDPKQDADGNWTVFVPENPDFQLLDVVAPVGKGGLGKAGQVDSPSLSVAEWNPPLKEVEDGTVFVTIAGVRSVDVAVETVAEVVATPLDNINN